MLTDAIAKNKLHKKVNQAMYMYLSRDVYRIFFLGGGWGGGGGGCLPGSLY